MAPSRALCIRGIIGFPRWPLPGEADTGGDREHESDACSCSTGRLWQAWVWELVRDEFDGLGIAHRAIDPPSLGSSPPRDAGGGEDAAVVRSVLDTLARPVVLVGNSYGGFVISAAAVDHPAVARLVYVAAHSCRSAVSQCLRTS